MLNYELNILDDKMVDGILESWINVENNENEILEVPHILGDVRPNPYLGITGSKSHK